MWTFAAQRLITASALWLMAGFTTLFSVVLIGILGMMVAFPEPLNSICMMNLNVHTEAEQIECLQAVLASTKSLLAPDPGDRVLVACVLLSFVGFVVLFAWLCTKKDLRP